MATHNQINLGLNGSTGTGSFVGSTAPTINGLTMTANITMGNHDIQISNGDGITDGNNAAMLTFTTIASAVNFFNINNNATGSFPTITATGSDSNVSFGITTKGTGSIMLNSNSNAITMATFSGLASQVDGFTFTGAATANPATITMAATGTDGNINIAVTPKGTGKLQLGNSSSFSANATTATVLGSLGPSGAHTTVQTWLTIIDSGGTTRYIPCF